ncbi:reticulocyte binding protein [Plasmodium knowlesi strain H]|uniref:Reticulocyte binding protein n=3 Tax=Plasmodium knowlesi TaxID=5850 RepID=A0A679L8H4_PLAKH
MKKNGLWGASFGVLILLMGASWEQVISESNKQQKEETNSSVNYYWGGRNDSGYPRRKRKNLQKHSLFPGKEEYRKSNTPSGKSGNESELYRKNSLIHVGDGTFGRKPSRYAYIKRNNEDNFYRNASSTKDANNRLNGIISSFLQNMKAPTIDRILDYYEIVNNKGELVFSLESYYVDIYTCEEIVNSIKRKGSTNSRDNPGDEDPEKKGDKDNNHNSGDKEDSMIKKLYDNMELLRMSCFSIKSELQGKINSLEYAQTEGNEQVSGTSNSKTYKLIEDEYVNCLKNNSENAKMIISNTMKSIEEEYGKIFCPKECNSAVYFENARSYISYVSNNTDVWYNSNISDAKEFLKSAKSIVSIIEREMRSSNMLSSIKFLQNEISNIINNYNYHFENIKKAISNIKKHENYDKPSNLDKNTLVGKSLDLAKNMSLYKFNNEMFKKMKELYDFKSNKFKRIFTFLADALKDKINLFTESMIYEEKYNSIMVDWKVIWEYVVGEYNKNLNAIQSYEGNENVEVIIVRNKIKEKLGTFKSMADELQGLFNIIELKYVIIKSEKSLVEELKNDFKKDEKGEYKFDDIIKLMEQVNSKMNTVQTSSNIVNSTYSNIKSIELKIQDLVSSIYEHMNEIEDLKVRGSTKNYISDEMKSEMLFIMENIIKLKEILSLEKRADENIKEIDELIMGTPLDMEKIIDKKSYAYNNIKMIIKDIYKDNLNKIVQEISRNMGNYTDSIDNSNSEDELDEVLKGIKVDYEKIKSMKYDDIPESVENITNLLKIISDAREEILKIKFGETNKKLTNSLEQLKSVYDKLKVSIAEYTAEKRKIEEDKAVILKREEEFFGKVYDKDDDMLDVKDAYTNFLKHKDNFFKNRNNVFEEFHTTKEALKVVRINFLYYISMPEKYNIIYQKENENYKELIKEINDKYIDTKLEEYESDFKRNNKLCDSIIKEVDQSNKNLHNLEILNRSIKECTIDKDMVEELIRKNNSLKEEIISERNEIEKDNFMEQNVKINLIVKLNDANITQSRKLNDNNLTNLKTQMKNIVDFYTRSKEKYKELNETELKKIKENDEWKKAKELIYTLNVEYEILKKQADDLISSKNSEIIKSISNRIVEKDKEINEQVEKDVNSLDQIIAKSKSPIFVRDINHYKNHQNKEKANQINAKVEAFVVKIGTRKDTLNKIKANSNQYLEEANGKKNENIEFKAKEKAMKELYEKVRDTSEELNKTLKEIHTLKDLQNIELEFEKSEIHDMVNQIISEEQKSEHEIGEINSYINTIDEMKKAKSAEEPLDAPLFVYTEFYEKAVSSHKIIKGLFKEATELNGKCENNESIKEVKEIKKKIDGYLRTILTNNIILHEALEDIKIVKEMLLNMNIPEIARLIEKYAAEVEKYSTLLKTEETKSNTLIEELNKNLENASNLKKKINKNLPIEQIDEVVKEVMKYKDAIAEREDEMNTYLKKSKEYRDNASLYYRNASSRKNKLEYLKKRGKDDVEQIDMDKVNASVEQCMTLVNKAAESEEVIRKHGERYMEYEGKMNSLINEISVLQIRTIYAKRKDEASNIMGEIQQLHTDMGKKLKESEEKLAKCKSESSIDEKAYILNNEKSKTAYMNVKLNLELIQSNLRQIKNVKESMNNILEKSTNLKNSILGASIIENNNSVDVLKKEEVHYMQYLKNIENEKKRMMDEKSNVDVIHDNVLKIEKELEKSKINYEEGILKLAKEKADEKKKLIEASMESLNSQEAYFTEMFNESYMQLYNIKEKFTGYKKSMKDLYDEFVKSYKVIETNAGKVAEGVVKYEEAKILREGAQKEQININNKEETAKTNLQKMKQDEFMNFLFHTREYVDKTRKTCEEVNTKVGEGHGDIKKIITRIGKLGKQENIFDILKKVEEKNNKMKEISRQCNTNEANNAFGKMIEASNFMGIKILRTLGSELSPGMELEKTSQTNSTLKFESEVEIKPENDAKLDAYVNLQTTYGYIQKIFNDSEEIDKKQEEMDGWLREVKNKCHDIKSYNELKIKINYTKYKGSNVLNKINGAFGKYAELEAITCSIEDDNKIIDNSEITKLRELSDTYNRKKKDQVFKSQINEVNEEFQGIKGNIDKLGEQFETVEKSESPSEKRIDVNSVIPEISEKLYSMNRKIRTTITNLNGLLEEGKTCEKSFYASMIAGISSQMSNDLILINNQKEEAEKYVEYIKKNSNLMIDDIDELNKYIDSNKINNYQLNILEEVIKSAADLSENEKEAAGIDNDIKKELVDVSGDFEMNSLNSSKAKIMEHYKKMKDKIKNIDDIRKNIKLLKLKEMESRSDKYLEIAGNFKNVLDSQITRLLDYDVVLQDMKKKLTENEEELKGINTTYTLQSIQKFNNVCNNIETNMQKIHDVEESNNNEEKQVNAYIENISHLISRGKGLLTDLDDYDAISNSETKELTDYTTKEYIENIKRKVNNGIEEFQNVLNRIEENKSKIEYNKNLNEGIYEIWKRANAIKENFSENLPENDNYFKLEEYVKDIKIILNEIDGDGKIEAYIENISQRIQEQIKHAHNNGNIESILEAKKNIESYNEEARKKLQSMKTAHDEILLKKKDMDNIFSIISVSKKNGAYINAKAYIKEVDDLFDKLNADIHKLETFINETKLKINLLEEEEVKLKTENAVTSNLNEQSENTSRDGDDEQLSEVTQNPENSEYSSTNSLHNVYELEENDQYDANHFDDNAKEESDDGSYNSSEKSSGEGFRYAAGITVAFFICSTAGYTVFTYNNDEVEEADFEKDREYFEYDIYSNKRDEEEIIEVTFDESNEYI